MRMENTMHKELLTSNFHIPPDEYYYEATQFNKSTIAIWICRDSIHSLIDRESNSIWGFYNTKTKRYHSPITSTKQGNPVKLERTTPYSAMIPNLNPLELCLSGAY